LTNLTPGFSLNQEAAPDPVELNEFRHSLSSKRNPLARFGGLFFLGLTALLARDFAQITPPENLAQAMCDAAQKTIWSLSILLE